MKTFIACLACVVIGGLVGVMITNSRYGTYGATFGPFDQAQTVSVTQAREMVRSAVATSKGMVELPRGRQHDFGVMAPDEEGEHTFIIRNVGEEELSLKLGASTCKCTLGELGDDTLPPGAETEVKMSWTVKTNEREFGQSAEIITNDPSNVAIKFEISGQVVRDLEVVPDTLTFGEVAAGEPIDMEARFYNYMATDIEPFDIAFSSKAMNELAEFEVLPFKPSEDDGIHAVARQGFLVRATLKPGLTQGPISQNLVFPFNKVSGLNASLVVDSAPEQALQAYIPVKGRIVGALSMLETTRLKGVAGGGYLYNFEKIAPGEEAKMNAFVRLKGSQQAETTLSIGDVEPEGVIEAELGPPVGAGETKLHSLKVKLIPSSEPVERLGLNRDDYGFVTIESDNPKVPPLKLRLKFSLPAR